MLSSFLFSSVLYTLASAIAIQPGGGLLGRAACDRDDCLRAVVASSAFPGPAIGRIDCSSFFIKTVTPCASTLVMTTTTTFTAAQVTSVVTASSRTDVTNIITKFNSQPTVTQTVTPAISTYTVTNTNGFPFAVLKKRQTDLAEDSPLVKRAISSCAVVNAPTDVPFYASACFGTARYSSACSCNGVSEKTITLPAATVVSISTASASTIPTTTSTVTLVNSVTKLTTTFVDVAPAIVYTALPTSTVTTTLNKLCPTFRAQVLATANLIDQPAGSVTSSTTVGLDRTFSKTAYYVLNADNTVSPAGKPDLIWTASNDASIYTKLGNSIQERPRSALSSAVKALTCRIVATGLVNTLSCSDALGDNSFYQCPLQAPSQLLFDYAARKLCIPTTVTVYSGC